MTTRNLEAWGRDSSEKLNSRIYSGSRTGWGLDSGHYQGYLDPVAVHPRPDSETSQYARHRINAVGQKYRIPVVVGHGAWPFKYEILSAPSGVTIGQTLTLSGNSLVAGADYGVVEWINPTAGTHTFEVMVLDQKNIKTYFKWVLVVSDSNWVYLDGGAAGGGNGTFATPYNSISQLNGLTTKGVLVKAGTVDWETKGVGGGTALNISKVFVPYNSGAVIFNQATTLSFMGSANDYWFNGITFKIPSGRNNVTKWMGFDGSDRVVFFENIIDLESYALTGGNWTNSSFAMWSNVAWTGSYNCVVNNQFNNISERDFMLFYSMAYLVIEGNTVSNSSVGAGYGHGFYLKMSVRDSTIRNNRSVGVSNTQKLVRLDSYVGANGLLMDNLECCYNSYYKVGSGAVISSGDEASAYGDARYIYRNSIVNTGAGGIQTTNATATDTITLDANAIMSDQGSPSGVIGTFSGTVVNTDYLYGNLASGMLDSNCKLQGAYLSNLGTKGAEVI